ncbi:MULTISPECIES: LuxR family transcriptional regulator [Rhizobium]|uniref:LuxR family transcriptional regulator n=1 Tax=Rhizobium favelukesii TaxID=348824 RepID=W6RMV6_9HYPH|nr:MULTISPECIES: LuxR family transcriptional regulator [Rhizobium]MCS0463477.1 LuxR family transcriptional regulator [Rhizobium favelukesii]UFS84681.1 LuxR family transcriptional regulator [Rhizobium sp. T136]CDM60263.1 LuxR family transcriptional regulator [Rhizobium favelukesii]
MQGTSNSSKFERAFNEIRAASNVDAAIRSLQTAYDVDHVTYHLAQTISHRVDAPFVRTTYPDAWVSRYLLNGYVKIDPVVREGFLRQLPFDWSEVEPTLEAYALLVDAQKHGLGGNGYSIPVADKARRRSLFSINSGLPAHKWQELIASYRDEWTELANLIHSKAVLELYGEHDPVPPLSPREIECLHWTALGKDYKSIALILEISEHTTRDYLKTARFKLGCPTLSAATTKAVQLRVINPQS